MKTITTILLFALSFAAFSQTPNESRIRELDSLYNEAYYNDDIEKMRMYTKEKSIRKHLHNSLKKNNEVKIVKYIDKLKLHGLYSQYIDTFKVSYTAPDKDVLDSLYRTSFNIFSNPTRPVEYVIYASQGIEYLGKYRYELLSYEYCVGFHFSRTKFNSKLADNKVITGFSIGHSAYMYPYFCRSNVFFHLDLFNLGTRIIKTISPNHSMELNVSLGTCFSLYKGVGMGLSKHIQFLYRNRKSSIGIEMNPKLILSDYELVYGSSFSICGGIRI